MHPSAPQPQAPQQQAPQQQQQAFGHEGPDCMKYGGMLGQFLVQQPGEDAAAAGVGDLQQLHSMDSGGEGLLGHFMPGGYSGGGGGAASAAISRSGDMLWHSEPRLHMLPPDTLLHSAQQQQFTRHKSMPQPGQMPSLGMGLGMQQHSGATRTNSQSGAMSQVALGSRAGSLSGQRTAPSWSSTSLVPPPTAPSSIEGDIGCSSSLYVKNLPPEANELLLYQHFAPHGAILSCKVLSDPDTGKCRGVGFVNYVDAVSAIRAAQLVHGTRIAEGRQVHVTLQAPRAVRSAVAAAAAAAAAPLDARQQLHVGGGLQQQQQQMQHASSTSTPFLTTATTRTGASSSSSTGYAMLPMEQQQAQQQQQQAQQLFPYYMPMQNPSQMLLHNHMYPMLCDGSLFSVSGAGPQPLQMNSCPNIFPSADPTDSAQLAGHQSISEPCSNAAMNSSSNSSGSGTAVPAGAGSGTSRRTSANAAAPAGSVLQHMLRQPPAKRHSSAAIQANAAAAQALAGIGAGGGGTEGGGGAGGGSGRGQQSMPQDLLF